MPPPSAAPAELVGVAAAGGLPRGRAIDPRLLTYTRSTRRHLQLTVALGVTTALLVVAQAWLIAATVAGAVTDHKTLAALAAPVTVLLAVVAARAIVAWESERAAQRASSRAKSELRTALAAKVAALGPAATDRRRAGDLSVLATTGVDALDAYFSRYLPQIFLATIVPLAILAAIVGVDWLSALLIAVTLPLIPLFMALVGAATGQRTRRQVASLQHVAGYFLDVVAGLPTLRVFGRARAQAAAIAEATDRYRRSTMSTLRLSFLSSLILELLATVSVALVAVAVGLRLLGGHLSLQTALFVLVLAPEAYLPLRLLGSNYHASAEGVEAAQQIFAVLDEAAPARGTRRDVPEVASVGLSVSQLTVTYPGARQPALDRLDLAIAPGETLAVVGPSGCGKSTLLGVLIGLVAPTAGSVQVGDIELNDLDPDEWRRRVAWVPQRPHLFATSIADNVRLGSPAAPMASVERAIADAGLAEAVTRMPLGLETPLGDNGAGLSAGERQRVALARAFLRDAPLLLLDEPTANLDGRTEEEVLDAVARLSATRTVVMAAHRPALLSIADRVVELPGGGR